MKQVLRMLLIHCMSAGLPLFLAASSPLQKPTGKVNAPPRPPGATQEASRSKGINAAGRDMVATGLFGPSGESSTGETSSDAGGDLIHSIGALACENPEAVDPTSLTVTKTWNGSGWSIILSWSGGTPGFTVSWSPDRTFQTSAAFDIPDDARGFYAFVQSHGRASSNTGAPFLILKPPGIGPYTNIRGITYVPSSGHVWIAADGIAQETDLFLHTPAVVPGRTWTAFAMPIFPGPPATTAS